MLKKIFLNKLANLLSLKLLKLKIIQYYKAIIRFGREMGYLAWIKKVISCSIYWYYIIKSWGKR